MKKLAWAQMQLYEDNITEPEYNRRYEEYVNLYKHNKFLFHRKWISKIALSTKKKLHRLLMLLFKAKTLFSGFSWEIVSDRHTQTKKPVIYAITHIGKFDIEISAVALKEQCTILTSDFERLGGTFEGFFLALNGVLYFNHLDKDERKNISLQMIDILKSGGNIMYFPEGTWNMTPNLPMLPCYWGIIDVAQKGGADIVPVAIEQYGKHFKINIGANIRFKECNSLQEKTECITALRDTMATLKWEIWESEQKFDINTIPTGYWMNYQKSRFREWPYMTKKCIESFGVAFSDIEFVRYNLMHIEDLKFKPKDIISTQQAFAHLNKLTPSSNTAFLYNKRNHF